MPDGAVHTFPDEATPAMMAEALGVKPPDAASPSGSAAPSAPLTAEGAGRRVGDVLAAAKNFVTGDNRREFNHPELPDSFIPGRGSVSSLLSLGRSPEAQLGIYQSLFPENPTRADKFGNPV